MGHIIENKIRTLGAKNSSMRETGPIVYPYSRRTEGLKEENKHILNHFENLGVGLVEYGTLAFCTVD